MSQSHEELAAELAGRWIDNAMKMAGITSQKQLAEKSGIARPTLCRLLAARESPSLETLLKILDACELDVVTLTVRDRRKRG